MLARTVIIASLAVFGATACQGVGSHRTRAAAPSSRPPKEVVKKFAAPLATLAEVTPSAAPSPATPAVVDDKPKRVRGTYVTLNAATHGIDGRLEVWVDPKYAGPEDEAHARWSSYVFGEDAPNKASPPPLWAMLILVDAAGNEKASENLGSEQVPYAAAHIRPLTLCIPMTPTFELNVDKSCDMGSFCGRETQLVRVVRGKLELVRDHRGHPVAATNALKSAYRIRSTGKEQRCEFLVKYSRLGPAPAGAHGPVLSDADFYTGYVRVRETRSGRDPSQWVYAERVERGLWESICDDCNDEARRTFVGSAFPRVP